MTFAATQPVLRSKTSFSQRANRLIPLASLGLATQNVQPSRPSLSVTSASLNLALHGQHVHPSLPVEEHLRREEPQERERPAESLTQVGERRALLRCVVVLDALDAGLTRVVAGEGEDEGTGEGETVRVRR